jgi:arylsulfatase
MTLASMVGLKAPPHDWVGNDGKGIYFDSIDNSAYILGQAQHSARDSWVYVDGENFNGARADIGGDPKEPWVKIAWKYLLTAKDSWLGAEANLGSIGALYNLTMDPYEKYDMVFNGAAPYRVLSASPGKYAGEDNGWVLSLIYPSSTSTSRLLSIRASRAMLAARRPTWFRIYSIPRTRFPC